MPRADKTELLLRRRIAYSLDTLYIAGPVAGPVLTLVAKKQGLH
jgi:hypothetical protein